METVHPLAGSVAVTEYDPELVTALVAPKIPPPQSKVAPPVEEEAVRLIFVTTQVIIAGGAMLTLGVTIF